MDAKKVTLGQFFTKYENWAQPQIKRFINEKINYYNISVCLDPFAGEGDLLNFAKENFNFSEIIGMDIDDKLDWIHNDSLNHIDKIQNTLIITNPPYLASYSARRKGEKVYKKVSKYFQNTACDDLYQVALQKMLENYEYVVAIIPETFINSNFSKDRVKMITILEDIPFVDTECPVCVTCFSNDFIADDQKEIYKNNVYLGTWEELNNYRKIPTKIIDIKFNDINGSIALRAVDNQEIDDIIRFMPKNDLDYNMDKIKVSSRLVTVISIPDEVKDTKIFSEICNTILNEYRDYVQDILLSPFKGNKKDGSRRRRLDYRTARAIIEEAYIEYRREYNE